MILRISQARYYFGLLSQELPKKYSQDLEAEIELLNTELDESLDLLHRLFHNGSALITEDEEKKDQENEEDPDDDEGILDENEGNE